MYGYRNVTENSVSRTFSTNKAKTLIKIDELEKQHPGNKFEIVEFVKKVDNRKVWKAGQGRAGNSYCINEKYEHWIEKK